MTNPKILRWTAFALALVALLLSSQLLDMHARGTSDPGLLGKLCGPESVGCDKVITSRYGYFPFAPEGVSGEELRDGRIPVAALGLFYATFLAIYLGLVGSPTWPVRRLHTAVLGVVAVGVLGSCTFLGIMWGVIGHTCPLCLGTHLCNFAVAFLLWKLRPTEPGFPQEGEGLVQPVLPFPDPRLGIALGLLVLAVCAAEWHSYRAVRAGHLLGAYAEAAEELRALQAGTEGEADLVVQNEELKTRIATLEAELAAAGPATDAEVAAMRTELAALREENARLQEFAGDIEILDAAFMEQGKLEIPLRDDDPRLEPATFIDRKSGTARSRTGYYMQVVVYGDPECPNCHKFHAFLEDELVEIFNGHLEVIYKHYIRSDHTEGLKGAKALEAARLQGNDAFWRMHAYLHERYPDLAAVDYTAAAQETGLDLGRFISDMGSAEVQRRIDEDMRGAANVLRIPGTPAVYLNKRPVSRAIRTNAGFWKIHAGKLKGTRERAGQPW